MSPSPLSLLCFDFDGLIVDTETPAYRAWGEIFERYGASLPMSEWIKAVGTFNGFDPAQYLGQQIGQKLDSKALFAEKEARKTAICQTQPLMDGVIERMQEAKTLGWSIAVVSTSDREWVQGHLERCGVYERVDLIITREDVKKVKPDPEPYLKAASKLKRAPQAMVVFEDSPNGVRAAKKAGAMCIAIPNEITRDQKFPEADAVISSLAKVSLQGLSRGILAPV
jgi:HAD superfamily hydrolase (TIGR01509 family)